MAGCEGKRKVREADGKGGRQRRRRRKAREKRTVKDVESQKYYVSPSLIYYAAQIGWFLCFVCRIVRSPVHYKPSFRIRKSATDALSV